MKRFCLFSLIILNAITALAGESLPLSVGRVAKWSAGAPIYLDSSLHHFLLDPTLDDIEIYAESKCTSAVRNFLNAGKNFASKTVLKYSSKISEFPRADIQSGFTYHLSKTDVLTDITNRNAYSEIFDYLRTRNLSEGNAVLDYFATAQWYLYTAGDSTSARSSGSFKYNVKLNPNDLVFYSYGDKPGMEIDRTTLVKQIEAELIAKDAKLKSCQTGQTSYANGNQPLLLSLAVEASGISAMSYYGVNNQGHDASKGSQWLQIVGPWAILNMKFDKKL